ncbi:argininosuccinate lyase [Candidatus Hecatella orcuttiae]|uniref:argininosuccinate lyase n=1 Tax=Candidatus Hecatella orcuttiae TaxID=1935119 RepID=UPI0028681BD2|nr:argininosuccinate lyase [Candidatus Hecatella orcuttiae]
MGSVSGLDTGIYRSRLNKRLEKKAAGFLSSIDVDEEIFEEDIDGTQAHNIMLYEQGIIKKEDLKKILAALENIRNLKRAGKLKLDMNYEDVHEFLEAQVLRELGYEVGGKLHTGRSRNDQVALDVRMKLRSKLNSLSSALLSLVRELQICAKANLDTLMVLYTHTQHAQIGLFSHYLLAYGDVLLRDFERIEDCYRRVNLSPLGASAIGGSTFNLNRLRTAELLGFDGIVENSIDAVSSRDFAQEAAGAVALLMVNLSRIAEDFVIWSSSEFNYLELHDAYASPSSVMPHKKNPCSLELIKAKAGLTLGTLTNMLATVKGVPTGYSRDLQETKAPLWLCLREAESALEVLTGIVRSLKVNRKRMREVAMESHASAVNLAEGLVKETGLSFRQAHMLVGRLVKETVNKGLKLTDLNPKALAKLSKEILGKKIEISENLFTKLVNPKLFPKRLSTLGSSNPEEIKRMLKSQEAKLVELKKRLMLRLKKIEKAEERLRKTVKAYLAAD